MASTPRVRPGQAPHHRGESEHEGMEPLSEGIQAAAATTGVTEVRTNSSITPGPVWFEFTNTASISSTTVVANLPIAGAGQFVEQFIDPSGNPTMPLIGVVLLPATGTPTPTLPVEQFTPTPLAAATPGLPTGMGVNRVTIETTTTPKTVTFHLAGSGTVAAGRRWMVFSVKGV